jgi:AcrR family transcriptional regulator
VEIVPKISEEQRTARREQILAGARRAFAAHGYFGTTVPVLEAEISLSRGAIFSYFPTKLDLFVALAEEDQHRVIELWIAEGYDAVVRHIGEGPEWIGVYLEAARMLRTDPQLRERWRAFNPEHLERLEHHLNGLRESGALRSDLPLESVARFLGVVMDGLAAQQGAGFDVDVPGTLELVHAAVGPK